MAKHGYMQILLLLLLQLVTTQSINCPSGQQPCGSSYCYDPSTQGCINGNVTIQCINSCNGTCYSSSQYCYNNVKVCNRGESICNVTRSVWSTYTPYGLTCYNSSQYVCSNNTMCDRYYSCGSQCLEDYFSACVNNRTICPGFYFYGYQNLSTCGSQNICYDQMNSTCVNGTKVCPLGNQLCDGLCYNPQAAYCTGGNNTIYCLTNPSSLYCSPPRNNTTPSSSTCCANKSCSTDADCCESTGTECQCYRHSQSDTYGSCVNPNVMPLCGDSCPVQSRCRVDSDCCKCQCASITLNDTDGNPLTRKQCIQRGM